PSVLLLDEPLEGLAPIIVAAVVKVIQDLVSSGEFAVIVVEQHVRVALSLTRQAIVLDRGRMVHQGSSETLLANTAALDRFVALA
ncbi:MAG TPA: ABC transporter ATP-binding protein, partial [Actinomycetota bacterium]|nr:ABC transporter ATP-binding protein [Actinomycetota bacterium]